MDVKAWLSRLGLEQYQRAFRENDVDAEVLPEFTAEDLIDLGVTSIGHRRKMLAAIDLLRDRSAAAREESGKTNAEASKAIADDLLSTTAERRQLTVMFCDLVGSTALSTRFDRRHRRRRRRLHIEVYGRWRPGLFRLSASA